MFRRQRCSRTLVLTFVAAVTYTLVCNIFTLYHLSRSKPTSSVHKYGLFYLGHLNSFKNWTCKPVELSKVDLPLTALASYPGSGNTWLRHLLQQSTGISTGSEYVDISLKLHGFPSEGIQNTSVLVIKTHEYDNVTLNRYDRAILLIREPKETLLAEFNRRHGGHHGHAQKGDFRREWQHFLIEETAYWYQFNSKWLNFPKSLHIILYDELKQNTSNELTQLLKFLKISISRKELLCVVRNIKGHFKRPGMNGNVDVRNLFTNSIQRTMDTYWGELKNAIKEIKTQKVAVI